MLLFHQPLGSMYFRVYRAGIQSPALSSTLPSWTQYRTYTIRLGVKCMCVPGHGGSLETLKYLAQEIVRASGVTNGQFTHNLFSTMIDNVNIQWCISACTFCACIVHIYCIARSGKLWATKSSVIISVT